MAKEKQKTTFSIELLKSSLKQQKKLRASAVRHYKIEIKDECKRFYWFGKMSQCTELIDDLEEAIKKLKKNKKMSRVR